MEADQDYDTPSIRVWQTVMPGSDEPSTWLISPRERDEQEAAREKRRQERRKESIERTAKEVSELFDDKARFVRLDDVLYTWSDFVEFGHTAGWDYEDERTEPDCIVWTADEVFGIVGDSEYGMWGWVSLPRSPSAASAIGTLDT